MNLEQYHIIVNIPKNTVKLRLEAKFLDESDEIKTAHIDMNVNDIYEARRDFLDNVEDGDDYDAVYRITEKGKEYLRQLE